MLIDGVHIPLTIPFDRDGASYLRKLEINVARYSLTPAAGLVALTTASEGPSLTDAEVRDALHTIGRSASAEKVLVAAITRESVFATLAVAKQAAAAGFDTVLLAPPTHWPRMQSAELGLFFRAVADRSPLPVMLSSEVAQGLPLPVALVAELAAHSNIIGIYDDALTIDRYKELAHATQSVKRNVNVTAVFAPVTTRMKTAANVDSAVFVTAESLAGGTAVAMPRPRPALKTRVKSVGFQIMASGSIAGALSLLEAGVAGMMPALAAAAPQVCYEAFAAFKDGDNALAAEKENRLLEADAFMQRTGIAAIKYGCDLNAYYGGAPRLPRLALDAATRAEAERVMAALKN